jgi:catechol 2,3-dioxygenase-like lactoylglutathione lyase family enzyme
MKITGFDHIVLRTTDIERALDFYLGALGLAPVRVDEWRAGEVGFPSVRVNDATIIDLLAVESRSADSALDHFCLVVEPLDWEDEIRNGLRVLQGPVSRYGARGDAQSVYVADPDGNEIELRNYGEISR